MMAGVRYPEASQQNHAGVKRSLSDDDQDQKPPKRMRIVRHGLRHKQSWHAEPTLAPQDEAFFQSQLLRSISVALTAVGFESAKPTALEAFRAHVDEYMRHFLSDVRKSMQHSRRSEPLPQDFTYALARSGYTSSDLEPQVRLPIPPAITQPAIPPPPPQEAPPPDLDGVLGVELSGASDKADRPYIPSHFPAFPSKHTWQATPVYSARETDPRKIRERATNEGIQAEQALRKLMAANRSGNRRKGDRAAKDGAKAAAKGRPTSGCREMWEEAMKEVLQEEGKKEREKHQGFLIGGLDGMPDSKSEVEKEITIDEGLLVNYDQKYWRKGSQAAGW